MRKGAGTPPDTRDQLWRSWRSANEWSVYTRGTGVVSMSPMTRCLSSAAACRVNVSARIAVGRTLRSVTRYAIRLAMTYVFPVPGPARRRAWEPAWEATERWSPSRPSYQGTGYLLTLLPRHGESGVARART